MPPAAIIPFRMNDQNLRRRIAELAQDSGNVQVTKHARQQMRQRKVTLPQVLAVLQRGFVADHARRNIRGNWQCTLEHTHAGARIQVAAALHSDEQESVIVITVINC